MKVVHFALIFSNRYEWNKKKLLAMIDNKIDNATPFTMNKIVCVLKYFLSTIILKYEFEDVVCLD